MWLIKTLSPTAAHKQPRPFIFFALNLAVGLSLLATPFFSASCQTRQPRDEAQAIEALRQMTRGGTVPASEQGVVKLETDYQGTTAGALARIVRARIKLKANDAASLNAAIALLDAREIRERTLIGDAALILRARALEQLGRRPEARAAYEQLARDYPASLLAREATLHNAELVAQDGASSVAAIPVLLKSLIAADDPAALLLAARAEEQQGQATKALAAYRRLYFYAPASSESAEAANAISTRLNSSLAPGSADEAITRADKLFEAKQYTEAAKAYEQAFLLYPALATPEARLRQGTALANTKRATEAISVLLAIPASAGDLQAQALARLVDVYASTRQWTQARATADQMRARFPQNDLTMRAYVSAGQAAKEARNNAEALNFFRAAVSAFPERAEVTPAQFEIAWAAHDAKNYAEAARLLLEHVALYAGKNSDFRGRAAYWAARDAERTGRRLDARALYEALRIRYDATWYGYLAKQKLAQMPRSGETPASDQNSLLARAVANLKSVTVAEETAGPEEMARINKADQLDIAGLDDWSVEELTAAQKKAPASPRVNLALARIYRAQNDNVTAFNIMRRSFPDYAQMEPEELTREQWDVFYPLSNWDVIARESRARNLNPYQVAGLIRQESVFNPRARSSARAYGLMQLVVPTGRLIAQKYNLGEAINEEALYQPALNIQLGTAYMREQLDRYGLIEYMAAAYNAGPGRVVTWRASLPSEMDEWAEAIPFKETRGYVQGVVRNMLQYERLYDENGKFRPEVGSRPVRPPSDSGRNQPNSDAVRPRRTVSANEEE